MEIVCLILLVSIYIAIAVLTNPLVKKLPVYVLWILAPLGIVIGYFVAELIKN